LPAKQLFKPIDRSWPMTPFLNMSLHILVFGIQAIDRIRSCGRKDYMAPQPQPSHPFPTSTTMPSTIHSPLRSTQPSESSKPKQGGLEYTRTAHQSSKVLVLLHRITTRFSRAGPPTTACLNGSSDKGWGKASRVVPLHLRTARAEHLSAVGTRTRCRSRSGGLGR
jgi:hypothetical protein